MNYIGENLRRFRMLLNLSLKDVGEMMGVSATAILKYENGNIVPDSKKLIEFAKIYNINVVQLLSSYEIPKLKFSAFRKKKRLTGQTLELLKDMISNEVAKYLEVMELNGENGDVIKLKKYKCNSIEEAESVANTFRTQILKINNKYPISDLTSILENLGVLIIYLENTNDKFSDFDGLSEIVDDRPIIVILKNLDGARQRFTLAHELAHLILDIEEEMNAEKICNRFASALLMPKEAVYYEFGKSRNKITFYELEAFKKEYKVSYKAIVYRLKELKVISEATNRIWNIYINKNIGSQDPEPIPIEISYQFEKIVHKLEVSDIISVQKACELLGVGLNEYND